MSAIVNNCGCGKSYSLERWRELPLIGVQSFDEPPYRYELRNCFCGSTLAITTDRDGNPCDEDGALLPVAGSAAPVTAVAS